MWQYLCFVGASYTIGRCFASLFWGVVADRIGRKPIIKFSILSVWVFIVSESSLLGENFEKLNIWSSFFKGHIQHSVRIKCEVLDGNRHKIPSWCSKWHAGPNKGVLQSIIINQMKLFYHSCEQICMYICLLFELL
jgi:hypothetical protein